MTAQECLDKFGFVPWTASKKQNYGDVVTVAAGGIAAVPDGDKLVITEPLDHATALQVAKAAGWTLIPGKFYYKAIAE